MQKQSAGGLPILNTLGYWKGGILELRFTNLFVKRFGDSGCHDLKQAELIDSVVCGDLGGQLSECSNYN